MNKPTSNTAWAIAETAKKIEAFESQRQSGWSYQEAPSSAIINSWMNAVHQWRQYLEQTGDEHEQHIEAIELHFSSLENMLKHQLEELQRHEDWLGRIQAYIESHPTTQPPPVRPASRVESPDMAPYKYRQIERNNGRGPR